MRNLFVSGQPENPLYVHVKSAGSESPSRYTRDVRGVVFTSLVLTMGST